MTKTNIEVLGHRVLIKPKPVEETLNVKVPKELKELGFKVELGDSGAEDRWFHGTSEGTVLQIGPMAWRQPDLGWGREDWKPWVSVGDKVQFVDSAHRMVVDPETKEKLFVVNDVDVLIKVN